MAKRKSGYKSGWVAKIRNLRFFFFKKNIFKEQFLFLFLETNIFFLNCTVHFCLLPAFAPYAQLANFRRLRNFWILPYAVEINKNLQK